MEITDNSDSQTTESTVTHPQEQQDNQNISDYNAKEPQQDSPEKDKTDKSKLISTITNYSIRQ